MDVPRDCQLIRKWWFLFFPSFYDNDVASRILRMENPARNERKIVGRNREDDRDALKVASCRYGLSESARMEGGSAASDTPDFSDEKLSCSRGIRQAPIMCPLEGTRFPIGNQGVLNTHYSLLNTLFFLDIKKP